MTSSLTVLSAYIPDIPVAPVSTISTNTVVLTWIAPSDNGSAITSYSILVRDSSSDYVTELTSCDGSNSIILAAQECTIPLQTLYDAPFNL